MNRLVALLGLIGWVSGIGVIGQENWTQFRGPFGNGHSLSRRLPINWSEQSNVVWKTELPGVGCSSPLVWSNQVWLTALTDQGRKLSAIAVDRITGKRLAERTVFPLDPPELPAWAENPAFSTPVLDEGRLYVYGTSGLAALDLLTGSILWERRDLKCRAPGGAITSPVLFLQQLFLQLDGWDRQSVVALDKKTGRTLWETPRSVKFRPVGGSGRETENRTSGSTPLVVLNGTQFSLMSLGGQAFYAYDVATGQELWRVEHPSGFGGWARPITGSGLVFTSTGGAGAEFWAIRTGGSNVVTESHVAWKHGRNVPHHVSPLMNGNLLFLLDDGGTLTCLEAKLGNPVWRERLEGSYVASPIASGGRLYLFNLEGKAFVVEMGLKFKLLAQNQLAEGVRASPAVYGRSLFVRSAHHLYRLEER